jgi:hypothetical protein
MDIIKTEQGLKIVIIISVRKPDDGSQVEAKVKAPKVFCYARWGFHMFREHGGSFSKVHTVTFYDWDTTWLIPGESNAENILFQVVLEVEIQPQIDEPPRASRGTYWRIGQQANNHLMKEYTQPLRGICQGE